MASSEDLAEEMFESLRRRIEAKLKERLNPPEASLEAGAHEKDATKGAGSESKDAGHEAGKETELPRIIGAVVISTPPVKQDR